MKFKKVLSSVLISGTILTSAVTAFADTVNTPSGGRWDYGVGGGIVWSNYYHSSLTHKSTAVGKTTYASEWKLPGYKSYASTSSASWGNKAYYDEN